MPSSPKLNTESTISCAIFPISSTPRAASAFWAVSLALSCASAGLAARASSTVNTVTLARVIGVLQSRIEGILTPQRTGVVAPTARWSNGNRRIRPGAGADGIVNSSEFWGYPRLRRAGTSGVTDPLHRVTGLSPFPQTAYNSAAMQSRTFRPVSRLVVGLLLGLCGAPPPGVRPRSGQDASRHRLRRRAPDRRHGGLPPSTTPPSSSATAASPRSAGPAR